MFDVCKDMGNPLSTAIATMNVSYKDGGVFEIKRVRYDDQCNMYLDYYILIESVQDREQYEFLR